MIRVMFWNCGRLSQHPDLDKMSALGRVLDFGRENNADIALLCELNLVNNLVIPGLPGALIPFGRWGGMNADATALCYGYYVYPRAIHYNIRPIVLHMPSISSRHAGLININEHKIVVWHGTSGIYDSLEAENDNSQLYVGHELKVIKENEHGRNALDSITSLTAAMLDEENRLQRIQQVNQVRHDVRSLTNNDKISIPTSYQNRWFPNGFGDFLIVGDMNIEPTHMEYHLKQTMRFPVNIVRSNRHTRYSHNDAETAYANYDYAITPTWVSASIVAQTARRDTVYTYGSAVEHLSDHDAIVIQFTNASIAYKTANHLWHKVTSYLPGTYGVNGREIQTGLTRAR